MLGKTHRAFGLAMTGATLAVASQHVPIYQEGTSQVIQITEILVASYLASSLPDVTEVIGQHRGITHTAWIVALLGYATYAMQHNTHIYCLLLGTTLGWLFHLLGDAFSVAGVAWFYPLQRYDHFGSGGFKVKGFRGIFVPLYHVGKSIVPKVHLWWYALAIIAIISAVSGLDMSFPMVL